jgi:hypothetical protein
MFKKCVCASAALLVLCLVSGSLAQQMGAWLLDEGSGTTVKDSSGNGNNGRFVGAPIWVPGKFGKALKFDGVDDYIEVPHSPSLIPTSGTVTVSVWINAERHTGPNNSQWQGILAKGGSPRLYNLYTEASQTIHFSTGPSGAYIGPLSTGTVPLNEWVHIAVVCNGRDYFYINGQPAGVAGEGATVPTGGTAVFTIGQTGESNFFQGMIDEVRLYDLAMTPEEILDLYNGNPPTFPKAKKPSPADGATDVTLPLFQWASGEGAVLHNVYLGTAPDLTEADLIGDKLYANVHYYVLGFTPGVTYYWRVDEITAANVVTTGDVWSFLAQPLTAYLPQPADDGSNVPLSPVLSWTAGQSATGHHVYFGTDRQAVEEGAAGTDKGSLGATELSYTITEALKPDMTYFWRVDETSLGGVVHTGPVWSFNTVLAGPVGATRQWWSNIGGGTTVADLTGQASFPDNPTGSEFVTLMEGPTDWADNYGTRLFGWVYPPQSGDYTFWIASDDGGELWLSTDEDRANAQLIASVASWTNSREWTKEATQRANPVKLEAGKRYYIEALQKEGGGGDNVAVAWQGPGFTMEVLGAGGVGPTPYLPQRAYSPTPADGALDTVQSVVLTWSAGEKALKHELYLGDDANAVAAADTSSSLFKGSQTGTSYDAGDLEWGKTYFWRVDEINTGEADSPWMGRVWSFTTANFIPVDDFESYDDAEDTGTRIYETWIDGYLDGSSGSTVGNLNPPFAEQTIVHGGLQSMPIDYDNTSSPFYSQAYREFSPLMNWTGNGVTDLSLWVRGTAAGIAPVTENAGKMTVSGEGADIWGTADQFTFVYKTLSGDGSLIARVTGNGTGSSRWAKGGVMIRDSLEAGSASAQMVMTGGDGNGAAFQNRASTDLDMNANDSSSNSTAVTAVAPPYWVKIERAGSSITASHSADGQNWTVQGAPQFIPMDAPAYIGICVTSHAAGEYRTFEFDNIKATGASGAWETKEIGLTRNSPQPLYVIVEDSTGKQATVVDPNAAVNATTWTEWKIPLADLAGVNLGKVKKLYIGVGDKVNPAADGTGRIYIDDIRVSRP